MKHFTVRIKYYFSRIRYALPLFSMSVILSLTSMPVYATTIGSSKLGTGLQKLINDLTTYLMIIAPIAMVVMLVYFFIRKGMSDEMDGKKWNDRIKTAIVSCVGAFLASVIVQLAQSYFG